MRIDKYELLLRIGIGTGICCIIVIFYCIFSNATLLDSTKKENTPQVTSTLSTQRDSLAQIFSTTSSEIDNTLLNDKKLNIDEDAATKLADMTKLRLEINDLLNAKSPNADLTLAKIKIEELQIKVALLQNKYSGVESENKRLQQMLNQLLASNKNYKGNTNSTASNNNGFLKEQKVIHSGSPERPINNTTTAAGLQLLAVMINNTKEQETNDSEEAEKMIGSFSFKNAASKTTNEVMVVVLQPDGRVVKNSVWESGTFETREGKKIYSRKVLVEPSNDEKRVSFSLTPDTFLSGDYIMQIWYNGNLIAKTVKSLI
jgi:hypothetical protein